MFISLEKNVNQPAAGSVNALLVWLDFNNPSCTRAFRRRPEGFCADSRHLFL
jgi:hypothetical protein